MENLTEYAKLIKKYSEEELEDILWNIDKVRYKDRYELIIKELKERRQEYSKSLALGKENIEKKPYPPWSTETVLEIIIGLFFFSFIIDFILSLVIGTLGATGLDKGFLVYSIYIILRTFIFDGLLLYIIYRFLMYYKLPFKEGLRLQRVSNEKILLLIIGGVFWGLCVILLGVFEPISETPLKEAISTFPAFVAFVLCAISVGPIVEEIFFRGYVYPAIEKSRGIILGVIITALSFGIIHLPQLWGAWIKITLIFITSFVLTLIRALTKSTLASIIFHLAYNISIFTIGILISLFSK